MLVINRRCGEDVVLRFPGGFSAVVRLLSNDRTKLGIEADQEIEVVRGEVLTRAALPVRQQRCACNKDADPRLG